MFRCVFQSTYAFSWFFLNFRYLKIYGRVGVWSQVFFLSNIRKRKTRTFSNNMTSLLSIQLARDTFVKQFPHRTQLKEILDKRVNIIERNMKEQKEHPCSLSFVMFMDQFSAIELNVPEKIMIAWFYLVTQGVWRDCRIPPTVCQPSVYTKPTLDLDCDPDCAKKTQTQCTRVSPLCEREFYGLLKYMIYDRVHRHESFYGAARTHLDAFLQNQLIGIYLDENLGENYHNDNKLVGYAVCDVQQERKSMYFTLIFMKFSPNIKTKV